MMSWGDTLLKKLQLHDPPKAKKRKPRGTLAERAARAAAQPVDPRPEWTGAIVLVLDGSPTTKKTSNRVIRTKDGKPKVMPAARYVAWEKRCCLQLTALWRYRPVDERVRVDALVYRRFNTTGDLNGYTAAVADMLQKAGVLNNDRSICSWGDSELRIDRERPRVEISITRAK